MKIRHGFVSNSSSASFTVNVDKLYARDAIVLMDYPHVAAQEGSQWTDYWDINIYTRGLIIGTTNMDNCDLSDYLKANNVDTSAFYFGD
jgi:hypothetical protein